MSEEEEDVAERHFTILYGTETGNAQDVAERIARQARRRRIDTSVYAMDDYDVADLINESLVIFVISTTGNGDFPTPSLGFWKFLLRSNLPTDILGDLTYATFGLGDSSYVRYCWSSRKLNKRLQGLGAAELVEAGEADDQHYLGIEGTLRPWMSKLWETLDEVLPPMKQGEKVIEDDEVLPPSISVRVRSGNAKRANGSSSLPFLSLPSNWKWSRLSKMDRMTSDDHWQDVRLIELQDYEGNDLSYQPGDVVSLMPENSPEDVDRFLKRMGWTSQADLYIELQTNDSHQKLPATLLAKGNVTLRHLLQTYIDFNSVPRPSFFEQLIPFTPTDHMQREKLQEFCTPGDGSDEMYEYAIRVRRTILETLEEFDAVKVPLAYLLDIFPTMQRRDFSIASSPLENPKALQLAIALVSYKTRLKEKRRGICTSWLCRLQVNDKVAICIRKSSTLLLSNPTLPAIFIGPGTGVAPIRSFLKHRLHLLSSSSSSSSEDQMRAQDNLCFFGCRNQAKDWLFSQEWKELSLSSKIEYHLAASRDQEEKVYVQHLIAKQGAKIWNILAIRKGTLYICGSSGKMPQAIREVVQKIACEYGQQTTEQAEQFITQLETQSRWLEECWS